MNKVIISGPMYHNGQGGAPMVDENKNKLMRFAIAIYNPQKAKSTNNQQKYDYVPCVSFGKTTELITKHFKHKQPIEIEGKWSTYQEEVTIKKNGKDTKLTISNVLVDKIDFPAKDFSEGGADNDGKGGGGGNNNYQNNNTPSNNTNNNTPTLDVDDDSLPF